MAKIKIDNSLYERAKKLAQDLGYSSVEEFVHHAIEKHIETIEHTDINEVTDQQLKGLGYIE